MLPDINERKQAEALAQQAAIVQSSDNAIIAMTLDGIIFAWNASAAKVYGYSAEEIKGHSISILIPPDRPDELPRLLEKIKQGEQIQQYETVRVKKNGKRICVSLTISPIKDASDSITGISIITRDITKQKLAEEALRESESKFRSIAQSTT